MTASTLTSSMMMLTDIALKLQVSELDCFYFRCSETVTNLKQNEAQSTPVESSHKGVN